MSGFYRWRGILQHHDHAPAAAPRPPRPHPAQPAPAFVPLRLIPDAVVEVVLPTGLTLRVPLTADAGQVARLVLALAAGEQPC